MNPLQRITWEGEIVSVQPRIRLTRSFDERYHTYLGYVLRVQGTVEPPPAGLLIAIGKAAQGKHGFRVGDVARGESEPVLDPRLECAAFYRSTRLRVLHRLEEPADEPPPWLGPPPSLEAYRARGHRRLAARTYDTRCRTCIWGCRMPVEMIIDPWDPTYRYRFETFCYGPKSCPYYRAGPTRKVPGRKGMVWEEEDWVDEQATADRGPDE